METGEFTSYIDLTQIILYVFWIFFFGLILYLHREGKREGYPLKTDRDDSRTFEGFPRVPDPKEFILPHDQGSRFAPGVQPEPYSLKAEPVASWPGAPLEPTGNPMIDGVGPGAWATRRDTPDLTNEGTPRIVPLRVDPAYSIHKKDSDPRGKPVYGADGEVAGTVSDVWVDRSEPYIRYLEIDLESRTVLVPITFVTFAPVGGHVHVGSILAKQFADVPGLANPDQITLQEEDRISAYYGGGLMYARREPVVAKNE